MRAQWDSDREPTWVKRRGSTEDAARTISVTNKYFLNEGLESAWNRVVGIVVQPGVEFGDDKVFKYKREEAKDLSRKITEYDRLVF